MRKSIGSSSLNREHRCDARTESLFHTYILINDAGVNWYQSNGSVRCILKRAIDQWVGVVARLVLSQSRIDSPVCLARMTTERSSTSTLNKTMHECVSHPCHHHRDISVSSDTFRPHRDWSAERYQSAYMCHSRHRVEGILSSNRISPGHEAAPRFSDVTHSDRMLLKRCFARPRRFPLATLVKSLLFLLIVYSINIQFGVKVSLWSEKSFENEYHLTMTRIDPQLVNEANAGRILGPPKYQSSTRYLIANEHLCHSEKSDDVRLLILVKSAIVNAEARQAIRLTWANKVSLDKNHIRLAFVLGRHENNITVDKESNQHGDIIQIDHIDNYYSNSRKSMPLSTSSSHRRFFLRRQDAHDASLGQRVLFIEP